MHQLRLTKLNCKQACAGSRQGRRPWRARAVLCAGVCAMLTACGGGDGSSPAGPTRAADSYHSDIIIGDRLGPDVYVANFGNDFNPGTAQFPLKTIQRAADISQPGMTVHVASGTYAENIVSSTSGAPSARIIYTTDGKDDVYIVPASGSQGRTLWQVTGDFIDIVGFDLSAAGSPVVLNGIDFSGGYSTAKGNHVHHIGNLPLNCSGNSGAGIKSFSDPALAGHTDLVENKVHDMGQGPSCEIHGIYLATSGSIKNNLVYNAGWGGIYLWRDNRNVDIVNNTVTGSRYGIIYGSANQVYDPSPADYINVANNIIYDNTVGIRNGDLGTLGTHNTMTNNLVYSNKTDWYTSTEHTGDISADPQFVHYISSGGGDYRLQSTSPAIDAASSSYAPGADIVGTRRPQGAAPDIGAYEFLKPVVESANELFVDVNNGDDVRNDGSQGKPFKTIQKAANVVGADTTVHVAPGRYEEAVTSTADGRAAGRIRYVSDVSGAAKLVGPQRAQDQVTEGMWKNTGSFVDIIGFDISGTGRMGIWNTGSHTLLAGNHIHDLTVKGGCTGNGGAGIHNSEYTATDNDTIGNLIHDIGIRGSCNGIHGIYHTNLGGHIYNNVVFRAAAAGIHLWHAAGDVVVANNTTFANGSASMGAGILMGNGGAPRGTLLHNAKILNNIAFDNPHGSISEYCDGVEGKPDGWCIGDRVVIANNLVYGKTAKMPIRLLAGRQSGPASGTIEADPQFVNYTAALGGNYALRNDSPAIDAGLANDAPSTDFTGAARPRGAGIDIGAYENF